MRYVKASETKLQPIIEGTKQYLVPLFQRTYSWEKKEWGFLWDDLIELSEMDNPREHFIGSIVTTSAVSVPEGVAKFLLIDGQQRLTTIFIILALLRDKFTETNHNNLAEEINNTLLINPYKKGIERYKLLPTHVDRTPFRNLIDRQLIEGTDNQIFQAYRFFERKIQQGQTDMIKLKDVISNHLSIVSIVLDQGDNPHLFVCNVPTNQLNKVFPPLYGAITKQGALGFIGDLKLTLQSKGYPKDLEFKARLQDANLYGSGDRARKTKLILERIEEAFNHKEQVPFEDLSIEHIMPQTLTENWQGYLGDDWEITHELLLHTLGNLTLTAYNVEMSNDAFDRKKERFVNSHLELNKYFINVETWKKEDMETRADVLAENALVVWPYFGEAKESSDDTNNVTGTTPNALWILGQRFKVNSWRDVFEHTLNTIADLEPEKFEQIINRFPRFVGLDKKKFRAVRELRNGAFIEVNLSAKSIASFCFQALELIELTNEEWRVDIA